MLTPSQPLNEEISAAALAYHEKEFATMTEENIKRQYVGGLFDKFPDKSPIEKVKSFMQSLGWKLGRIKEAMIGCKLSIKNHVQWHKTISGQLPFDGYHGLIELMQAKLKIYIDYEEKYGMAKEEYKERKIASAKEMVEILGRIEDPYGYLSQLQDPIDARYPKYLWLNTEYKNGGASHSGSFVVQGNGWAGYESGEDAKKGYFEFVDGKFTMLDSPNEQETKRLLDEMDQYKEEKNACYEQAKLALSRDFDRFGQLFKDHLHEWWD